MVNGRQLAYNEIRPPAPKGTILLLTGLAAKRYGWYRQFVECYEQFNRDVLAFLES